MEQRAPSSIPRAQTCRRRLTKGAPHVVMLPKDSAPKQNTSTLPVHIIEASKRTAPAGRSTVAGEKMPDAQSSRPHSARCGSSDARKRWKPTGFSVSLSRYGGESYWMSRHHDWLLLQFEVTQQLHTVVSTHAERLPEQSCTVSLPMMRRKLKN